MAVDSQQPLGMRRITAHHEAGHAVVAMAIGCEVFHIVIEGFQDGITCTDELPASAWRDDCLIRVAGQVAERRLLGPGHDPSATAEDERQDALKVSREHSEVDAEAIVDELESTADRILESNWSTVVKIAGSLQERDLYPHRLIAVLAAEIVPR